MPLFARYRRLRSSANLRRLIGETRVSVDDFIYPLFITAGQNVKAEIPPMPDCYQLSVDRLSEELDEIEALGIPGVLLFGLPAEKDPVGSDAYADNGIIQQAVREAKRTHPDLLVITDVCLCEYTDLGHCGVVLENGTVDNDATIDLLAKEAVSHARAGADLVAPSSMMDGQIAALRTGLDGAGFLNMPIMAYAAKYSSALFGPFRVAADSAPEFGDRRSYQMDPGNSREAMLEVQSDIDQGADIVMVKPALAYLDVIREARRITDLPVAAYNVSGEYAMVKAAAANEWLDGQRVAMEVLGSIKRAGADIIITYHAKEAARWLA
ncbi:MAG TPA: porphobilinogen synthase [Dehalococcoidia bacterium]|nr:porphobilinogen synthase [Chloroflexota bacterium]HCV27003.1 porphobilinogen synthase [Dehalococcoidia bacterium]